MKTQTNYIKKNQLITFIILILIYTLVIVFNSSAQVWTKKPDITNARFSAIAFALNGKIYVGGGQSLKDFWEFNPANNSWSQKADLPATQNGDRVAAVSFVINNKAYVGLGADHANGQF